MSRGSPGGGFGAPADATAVDAVKRGLEHFAPYLFARATTTHNAHKADQPTDPPARQDPYGSSVDAEEAGPAADVWCPHEANDVDSPPKTPRQAGYATFDDAAFDALDLAHYEREADAIAPKLLPCPRRP